MDIYRIQTNSGPRWAIEGRLLRRDFTLEKLLEQRAADQAGWLHVFLTSEPAQGSLMAPIEPGQEVWASGVTYLRSREAREAESASGDIYQRVYQASRPELFFKAIGWRVVGSGEPIRVRSDSRWNVPEPELTLVLNRAGEICGYTAGNDVSSRDIEGENPLYLPQAKVYNGSCALGPRICLSPGADNLQGLPIRLEITRDGAPLYQGETNTRLMVRKFEDLAGFLYRELDFPGGAFLLTGTGIVPPEAYSLQPGDVVTVTVGDLTLCNPTASR